MALVIPDTTDPVIATGQAIVGSKILMYRHSICKANPHNEMIIAILYPKYLVINEETNKPLIELRIHDMPKIILARALSKTDDENEITT